MHQPIITGSGVFTPPSVITNDELVVSFNAFVDRFNAAHEEDIALGDITAKTHSNADFIRDANRFALSSRNDERKRGFGNRFLQFAMIS